jgi:hypothetical protein
LSVDAKVPLLPDCNSIKEQTTSLIIASTCSVGVSPAFFGEIDGQVSEANIIPIKHKLIRKAFKILGRNFITPLYYICEIN